MEQPHLKKAVFSTTKGISLIAQNRKIMQRTDPYTGEVFTPHRTNQKFACRENQIRYNNQRAAAKRKHKAPIDRQLDKNRTILKHLLAERPQVEKSVDFLLGAGFNFGCTTHRQVHKGQAYSCVYEYGIRKNSKGMIEIFRTDAKKTD